MLDKRMLKANKNVGRPERSDARQKNVTRKRKPNFNLKQTEHTMSKIMQVLEQLGQDANLQTQTSIKSHVATAELDNELTEAIINKDEGSLKSLLNISNQTWCVVIHTPEDDESEINQSNIKAVSNG